MEEPLKLDYFYGIEADQFTFYRIPRILVKDDRFRNLSSDAKLLYGLKIKLSTSVLTRRRASRSFRRNGRAKISLTNPGLRHILP